MVRKSLRAGRPPSLERGGRIAQRLASAALCLLVLALLMAAIPTRIPRSALPGNTDHGSFVAHAYDAPEGDLPLGIVGKGSYNPDDGFAGDYQSAWYAYSDRARVLVCGYPRNPGLELVVEAVQKDGSIVRTLFLGTNPGTTWGTWDPHLPANTVRFRILASDQSRRQDGWMGVSAPFKEPLLQPLRELPGNGALFIALFLCGILLTTLTLAFADVFGGGLGEGAVAVGLIATSLCAYLAFWAYFLAPWLGWVVSVSVFLFGAVWTLRSGTRPSPVRGTILSLWAIALVVGLGFAAVGLLYRQGPFPLVSAVRFQRNFGTDNAIPGLFAERLFYGLSPKHLVGDWLSSDRPPLQAGWVLLFKPVLAGLGCDAGCGASACGILFELLWVPALWLLVRRLGGTRRLGFACIAAAAFTGVMLFNTDFTWPKLSAAALTVFAFLFWYAPQAQEKPARRYALAGLAAALGWLAHGGVAFSLLALVPLALRDVAKGRAPALRLWLISAGCFALLAAAWIAYGRFYEPPGDRLLKMHLAGAIRADDTRPFLQALRENYQQEGARLALAVRLQNWSLQGSGHWAEALSFRLPPDFIDARWDETEYLLRSFGWWLWAAPAALWLLARRRLRLFAVTSLWWALGVVVSVDLLFMANQALVHQGSLVTQLAGFGLLLFAAAAVSRWLFAGLFAAQLAAFLLLWIRPTAEAAAPVNPLSAAVAVAAGLVLLLVAGRFVGSKEPALER